MGVPSAEDLWPSLDESLGRQPCFPAGEVWSVLPTLKGQMLDMLSDVGSNTRNDVSFDESNGLVHIHDSAVIEPGVHIIGPAYIGPNSTIRHGAYIREYSSSYQLLDWIDEDKTRIDRTSNNPNAINLIKVNLDKIDWCWLSANPNAIHLLEQNQNKTTERLSGNPNIFTKLPNY